MTRRILWIIALLISTVSAGPATQPGPIKPAAVTASAAESKAAGGFGDFPADKTVDGDLSPASSWRAEIQDEKLGQWIQYDLGRVQKIGTVRIAFLKGDERVYRFEVDYSTDGENWTSHPNQSSGKAKGFEDFSVLPGNARYVRIVGFGNNSEKFAKWINVVEVQILPASDD
jgi:hypothetical protein